MRNKPTLMMSTSHSFVPRGAGWRLLSGALAVACAWPSLSQSQSPSRSSSPLPSPLPASSSALPGAAARSYFSTPLVPAERPDDAAGVARIEVETDRDGVAADGQSAVGVSVRVLGKDGLPLKGKVLLTVETSGGRILQDGAATDALGPQGGDADRVTPGVQLPVEGGRAHFRLLAPSAPQDVLLRVGAGRFSAEGVLHFLPELRHMVAAGLVEGVISKRTLTADALAPARFDDGFEQDITRWSRQFDGGKANAGARGAFFVKGTIRGDKLLTAAYDSDQATRERLMRDIDPNAFYPVYGDSALTGFDARSAGRLYVRIDAAKSYLLYGDFSTGETSAPSVPGQDGPLAARKLGQYQRTATGLRGHWDGQAAKLDGFAFHDRVKQVIEEYRANGSSGPFAVRNNGALANSERVELIVRDKNQTDLVKQVTPLRRLDDYNFEPFSGRILFKQAIASLTPEGDPQSIRVSYEVDQGGEDFWVLGASGEVGVGAGVTLGAALADDANPQSPYRLQSVNLNAPLGPRTRLVAELAHSVSTSYTANGQVFTTPSGQAGELGSEASGRAGRVELSHQGERITAQAHWQRAGSEFNNTAGGIAPGHVDAGAKVSGKLSEDLTLYTSALQSRDALVVARRDAARVGLLWQAGDKLAFDVSLQHMKEEGDLSNQSALASNTGVLASGLNPAGGFFGFGNTNSAISPVNGAAVTTFAPVGPTLQPGPKTALDASTVALGAHYQASPALTVNGVAEHGIADSRQRRFELGAQYQLSERSRAYAHYENQTGLASRYALNPAEKSNAFVAGVESSYLPGASVFTEYRLRDALATDLASSRDLQLASGARNTWNVAEGLAASSNAEYLHVFDGRQQKGVALSGALDYTAQPLWKASAKLEWRRLFDNGADPGNQTQDQWLSTLSLARKLERDWTLLARNYALFARNHDDVTGAAIGNSLQERAQLGLAWRPVDHNRFNGLARYEFKNVRDDARVDGESYAAHIVSTHLDYHPSRPWWMTGRLAAKSSTERRLPAGSQNYRAALAAGRVVYDIAERWDLGLLGAVLRSPQDGASQFARGLEVGYLLKANLWLSAGYNVSGFRERDLASADYTAKGAYLRLRFKFDESLFQGGEPAVNRALAR